MEENPNQPEPSMSKDNDENQNPELWKDLPWMGSLPAPYEQFKKDVEPYAVDVDFWDFCYEHTFLKKQFVIPITDEWELETLYDYKQAIRSRSLFWETYENAGQPSEEPLWLVGPDGIAHRMLFRFLDGGYALVGDNSAIDPHLSIVPLSELTEDKIYRSEASAIREQMINHQLVPEFERFQEFAKNTLDLVKRWHSEEGVTRREMDAQGIDEHMLQLYRSDHAASVHRCAVFYKHMEQEREENPDPEETQE